MLISLPPSFILLLLLAMIGIPMYLVAFGGLTGPDPANLMSEPGGLGGTNEGGKGDKASTPRKKRPNDDPGSPLDVSELGGLGVLVGLSALVVIAFALFPQELNSMLSTASGHLDLPAFSRAFSNGAGDAGLPLKSAPLESPWNLLKGAPQASIPPLKGEPQEMLQSKRSELSYNTVNRHLRLLRAQPVLLIGYNEDHMGAMAAVLGVLGTLASVYVFGQMIWDSQDVERHQARLDFSTKQAGEDMKKAEMYSKRAELFDQDAERIRRDKINMLEEIKTKPPWWNGDLKQWRQVQLERRQEETNMLAKRASQKAALFRRRQKDIEEKWQPQENTTSSGRTVQEENIFPGIPLLHYMRTRRSGAKQKTKLDRAALLESYVEPARLIVDTEDYTSRRRFKKEAEEKHPSEKLKNQKGLRRKMYKKWWDDDRDLYTKWVEVQNDMKREATERTSLENAMRSKLEKRVSERMKEVKPAERKRAMVSILKR